MIGTPRDLKEAVEIMAYNQLMELLGTSLKGKVVVLKAEKNGIVAEVKDIEDMNLLEYK